MVRPTLTQAALILGAGAALWAVANGMASSLAGTKPTTMMKSREVASPSLGNGALDNSALEKLRADAAAQPTSLDAQRALASALLQNLRGATPPSQGAILEVIDVVSTILKLNPKEKEALLVLGDISFEQQVFDKAASYYAQYITLDPEDLSTRARYASSLAFQSKYKDAERELLAVLKKNPTHFASLAYLTVAYAQMGEKAKSLEVGTRALAAAPTGEAKEELQGFIQKVKDGSFKPGTLPTSPQRTQPLRAEGAKAADNASAVASYLQANAIAGPKFVRAENNSNSSVSVFMRDFPMEGMPPFAKQKFFAGIKSMASLQSLTVSKIIFIDIATGTEMETLTVVPVN